jgi:hypothetical protein
MRRICAWCQKDLGRVELPNSPHQFITHGICDACAALVLANPEETLLDFLDRLEVPVLVVLPNARILTANQKAQKLLGKELRELQDYRGGEVIECRHAHVGKGCGYTVHCQSCTIRLTVQDTFATGRSHIKVPAYPDQEIGRKVKTLPLLISTEKFGSYVLLRIDDLRKKPKE